MPDINDFHTFKSTGGESGSNSGGGGFGCSRIIILVIVLVLILFIADGTSWDAIDTLLGLGLLVFLFFR